MPRWLERILVGVDGSWESRQAVRYAADLAKSTGSQLILATVVNFLKAFGAPELLAQVEAWEEEEKERSAEMLRQMGCALRRRDVRVEMLVLSGSPADALCEQARVAEVDLVVVGSRGHWLLRRMLLGSVADRLVRICPMPVTVVAQRLADRSRTKRGNRREVQKRLALPLKLAPVPAPGRGRFSFWSWSPFELARAGTLIARGRAARR